MPSQNFNKRLIIFLVLSVFFILSGCNSTEDIADDSSKEAEIERGLTALDESNYEKAKNIFENLKNKYPNDNNLKAYYSNSLAGLAGLDTYNLMKTIDYFDKSGNEGDTISIVGRTLSKPEAQAEISLNSLEIKDKIKKFEEAMDAVLEITDKKYSNLIDTKYPQADVILGELLSEDDIAKLTTDEFVQLGLIAINHAILIIGDILLEISGDNQITFSENNFKISHETNNGLNTSDITLELQKLSIDIELIFNASKALIIFLDLDDNYQNDLNKEFELFRAKFDNGNGDDSESGDGYITFNELEYYLNNL
ncbi:MAG: hypothetical protein RBR08_00265 [Desulforegulaceae bacterium]|nr:hypothetical protein [Desulforegulaceae bacterium]